MRIDQLLEILSRIESLAELEDIDSKTAKGLRKFVDKVNQYCHEMADAHAPLFDNTLALADHPSAEDIVLVLDTLRSEARYRSEMKLRDYCDDLEVLAEKLDKYLFEVGLGTDGGPSMSSLVQQLHITPIQFYNAFDVFAHDVIYALRSGDVGKARAAAGEAKTEVRTLLKRVNAAAADITGSSSDGAHLFLTKAEIAEDALRRPERVLLLNMALLILLLVTGATVLQYVSLFAFPLLVAFVLAGVVVVNALYLRSIDRLSEESFMELMKLALLNFFAPLARSSVRSRSDSDQGGDG